MIDKMENTLKTFSKTLIRLNKGNNLVLGGSCALSLHGLNTSRVPEDVDIILYKPNPSQIKLLELLSDFSEIEESYGKVFKFKKEGYTLDILINIEPEPKNLLFYINGEIKIKVQNVSNIVKAKASYKRKKDFLDLISLKNLNFNVD